MVTEAARTAVAAAYSELSEELLEERVAIAEELAQKQRELKAAWERSDATVRVAADLERAKEAAEAGKAEGPREAGRRSAMRQRASRAQILLLEQRELPWVARRTSSGGQT